MGHGIGPQNFDDAFALVVRYSPVTMDEVASAGKVAFHRERIEAYLRGEPVYPVSMELDITSQCTRQCEDCPSSRSQYHHELSMGFVRELFASLGGRVKGLLLSGGEATIYPEFAEVLALARREGFEDIAIVTNGSRLHEEQVAEALMEHASTIRISLYDWDEYACGGIQPMLAKIEALRRRIDRCGSGLKIGVSALTTRERAPRLAEIGEAVHAAGAHWIYYHPMCVGWSDGHLKQLDQAGVVESVTEYQARDANGFGIFIASGRYGHGQVAFDGYHSAHFLLVIGADGVNYLGAEVKYQDRYALADVAGDWRTDFLHRPERLEKIRSIDSRSYTALSSRHRGVLYSDLIERMKGGGGTPGNGAAYSFPHIL